MPNLTICNEQKITSYTSARRKPRTGPLKYRVKIFNEYARMKSRIGAQKYWLTIFTEKISRTPRAKYWLTVSMTKKLPIVIVPEDSQEQVHKNIG